MAHASVLSVILDPNRLRIAGALVGVSRSADELAERTGLGRREVLQAVGVLRQAGLVDGADGAYTLPVQRLHELAKQWSDTELPMDPYIGYGMDDAERKVLARFFQGRTLSEIPAVRAKRLVVLERLALEFDLGRRYPEAVVNDVLRSFHDDFSSLRRYLVDEGLLDRDQGEYWRSGGRFPAEHER